MCLLPSANANGDRNAKAGWSTEYKASLNSEGWTVRMPSSTVITHLRHRILHMRGTLNTYDIQWLQLCDKTQKLTCNKHAKCMLADP